MPPSVPLFLPEDVSKVPDDTMKVLKSHRAEAIAAPLQ